MSKIKILLASAVIAGTFFLGIYVANTYRIVKADTIVEGTQSKDSETSTSSTHQIDDKQNTNISQNQQTVYRENGNGALTPSEEVNISVYESRNKSVVNITTEVLAYNWFFEPVPQEGGIGSGSIIDEKGYVLTNYHVVENANKVYVTLWDGNKLDGKVIGFDRENDLAIIQIDPRGIVLSAIPVGDSNSLKVGQMVLAIGNPFGLDRTLTSGIISGIGRPIRSSTNIVIQNMIQTDASINPGNSGGPLLNSKGEMIGVNTIIVTPSRGSVGVGFAVPSATVKRIIPDLIAFGKVKRGWIDWDIRPLFPELVQYAKLPVSKGMLVEAVAKNGTADKAGIRGGNKNDAVRYGRTTILLGGDIVVKVNGQDVFSVSDYLESLEQTKAGDSVKVEYFRRGKLKTVLITLTERPADLVIK